MSRLSSRELYSAMAMKTTALTRRVSLLLGLEDSELVGWFMPDIVMVREWHAQPRGVTCSS